VRRHPRLVASAAATVGALLVAIGIVYLTVACEDLPGILGPHPGDTSPRTPLGVVGIVLGLAGLAVAIAAARRRPPSGPIQS
jgi:hypothetical protein